jgi:molybdopterin synthase catalytic subunit
MFSIQDTSLDIPALRADAFDPTCGALVVFEGLVRNHHEGRDVTRLHYTHHPVLAQKEGERIIAETLEKFPAIQKAVAIHRIGTLEIGECAVVTLTTSAHRAEAFEANRYLIDSIKARVPIWKQETYATGEVEWTAPCPGCMAASAEPENHSHEHDHGDHGGCSRH